MQDLAHWLEELGLSEYAQRFAENRIDLSILPDVTDQDLKELGIVLGDRRKILRAIGELRSAPTGSQTVQSVTTSPTSPVAKSVSYAVESAGERRHVTVMFCDLVG